MHFFWNKLALVRCIADRAAPLALLDMQSTLPIGAGDHARMVINLHLIVIAAPNSDGFPSSQNS